MIRIAIVDDDEKLCSKIEQSLIAYRETTAIELDIELFYSGESFYHFLTSEHDFELIFLDIQMKSIDGVEVGHLIREKLNNNIMQIVYITSLDTRDRELFDIRPMSFIAKPISDSKIFKALETYLRLYTNTKKMFDFVADRQHLKIPYDQIIYLQSDDKKVIIQTKHNMFSYYGKLSDAVNKLPFQFICVHKSFVINKFYIKKYNYDNVVMVNNEVISISKSNQRNVRKLLMQDSIQAGEEFFS